MSSREKTLMVVFCATLGIILILLSLSNLLDQISQQDFELTKYKRQAVQLIQKQQLSDSGPSVHEKLQLLESEFLSKDKVCSVIEFSTTIQKTLESCGLTIKDFKTLQESSDSGWVEFNIKGNINQWFQFLILADKLSPHPFFRSLQMKTQTDNTYTISFEAGYERLE